MKSPQIEEAIELLTALIEEGEISKKVADKAQKVISILQNETSMPLEKALLELEDLNNYDLSSYHRTQLWSVISALESVDGQ